MGSSLLLQEPIMRTWVDDQGGGAVPSHSYMWRVLFFFMFLSASAALHF